MTTCPSGVDYMHLVDIARTHIEQTGPRPMHVRLIRRLLAAIVPDPRRFRLALKAGALARPFAGLLRRIGLPQLAAMLQLVPRGGLLPGRYGGAGTARPKGERRGRVLLLAGCAQQVLRPAINDATIRLLARRGVEVVVAPGATCCGALVQHMGLEEEALAQARRTIAAWSRMIRQEPVDAILITASGCGTTVKDYGHMLQHDGEWAERAAEISALTKDVTEFLSGFDLGPPRRWSSLRIAYHSACSMQHGQKITEEPRALLEAAGFAVVEIPEGHLCCGSAGTYNILQPEIAGRLLERKVANIESVGADLVATGNIGCITQISRATRLPVVHTVELLDWAYGGPVPQGLGALAGRVRDVPVSTLEPA